MLRLKDKLKALTGLKGVLLFGVAVGVMTAVICVTNAGYAILAYSPGFPW
ncbi:hypothetical protein [Clostridium felsineum]|nr:hypothetical protein [Clostridium felsineum]URZ14918.1 hypothetical protein CLFE_009310 [Clostridium felsineum DSM 794]